MNYSIQCGRDEYISYVLVEFDPIRLGFVQNDGALYTMQPTPEEISQMWEMFEIVETMKMDYVVVSSANAIIEYYVDDLDNDNMRVRILDLGVGKVVYSGRWHAVVDAGAMVESLRGLLAVANEVKAEEA